MTLDPIKLRDFLARANAPNIEPLPLVHSTRAKNVYDIFRSGKVLAMRCNVFNEDLCYCFVGRPAYKWQTTGPARYWQLPLVVVTRFDEQLNLRRVFPFDSGAFLNKMPDYLTAFDLPSYGIEPSKNAVGRMISVFFDSNKNYYLGKGNSEDKFRARYELTPRHQEIQALIALYNDNSLQDADDRARAIEVQIASDIVLSANNLIGVVIPSEYRRDTELVAHIRQVASHIRYYEHYPVNSLQYTTSIFEEVRTMLRKSGCL